MSSERRTAGLVVFFAICLFGSWTVAATIRAVGLDATHPIGIQLLALSVHYLATMGVQPLLAAWIVRRWVDRAPLDLAIRPPAPRFSIFAVTAACALATAACALGYAFGHRASFNGAAERGHEGAGIVFTLGAATALVLVWLQAAAEELGWRGYVLPATMQRFGRWRGLVLQAVMWGAWYAPVVFFATLGRSGSFARCASFVVTCTLLGVLLGWLRLAAKSVGPAVTANVTLTLVGGMPYVLFGIDAGLRSTIYRPIGWFVLAAALAGLLLSRWRDVVRVPKTEDGEQIADALVLLLGRRDRTLH